MRRRILDMLLVSVPILVATGCTTASAPSLPQKYALLAGIGFATQMPYAYACDGDQACYSFDAGGHVTGTLGGLKTPTATTTDAAGNWYIVNYGTKTVLEYSPGGGSLEKTLTDPGQTPVDVAVSSSTQTVAVANDSSVSVYVGGATSPTRVLTDDRLANTSAVAFDNAGNCYISATLTSFEYIDKFTGCTGKPKRTGVLAPYISSLAFDRHDNLYFGYTGVSGSNEFIYRCKKARNRTCHRLATFGFVGTIRFNGAQTLLMVVEESGDAPFALYTLSTGGVKTGFAKRPSPSSPFYGAAFATGPAY